MILAAHRRVIRALSRSSVTRWDKLCGAGAFVAFALASTGGLS